MPIKSPFYGIPEFQPTGIPEVDRSLAKWKQDFGASYTRNLFEAERIPFHASTFSSGALLLTTATWGTTVITKTVGFQGGEDILVIGTGELGFRGSTVGAYPQATLFITMPDGSTQDLSSRLMRMGSSGIGTTNSALIVSVSQIWKPTVRIQMGGLHTFRIRADSGQGAVPGAGTTATISDAGLSILAF